MSLLKATSTALILAYIVDVDAFFRVDGFPPTTYTKKFKPDPYTVKLDDNSMTEKKNVFAYVTCPEKNGADCTAHLEYFHPDGVEYRYSCPTTFPELEDVRQGLRIATAYSDKLAFLYYWLDDDDRYAYAIRVLNMNSCEGDARVYTNYSRSASASTNAQVLSYDDGTFEAFVRDENLCSGARCKVAFDSMSKVISEPVPYFNNSLAGCDVKMYPKHSKSSRSRFFAVLTCKKNESAAPSYTMMYTDGKKKLEKELLRLDGDIIFNGPPVIYVSSALLSVCWYVNEDATAISCAQYYGRDEEDDERFNATVNFRGRVRKFKIMSEKRKATALVLFADECEGGVCGRLSVRYVYRDGRVGRAVAIDKFRCDDYTVYSIVERMFTVCVNFYCHDSDEYTMNCYSMDHLSY